MTKVKMALRDIEQHGQTFQWDDQSIWADPLAEFHLPYKIVEGIKAEIFVLPETEGCLFRGKIRGKVSIACDRCTEETVFTIASDFDEFEEYPKDEEEIKEELWGENRILFKEFNATLIDFGALLWEEFVLVLPSKPLCSKDCKGICSNCGKNLNNGICGCEDENQDPRFAALRNIKIQ